MADVGQDVSLWPISCSRAALGCVYHVAIASMEVSDEPTSLIQRSMPERVRSEKPPLPTFLCISFVVQQEGIGLENEHVLGRHLGRDAKGKYP
jgi:hypothetical protein